MSFDSVCNYVLAAGCFAGSFMYFGLNGRKELLMAGLRPFSAKQMDYISKLIAKRADISNEIDQNDEQRPAADLSLQGANSAISTFVYRLFPAGFDYMVPASAARTAVRNRSLKSGQKDVEAQLPEIEAQEQASIFLNDSVDVATQAARAAYNRTGLELDSVRRGRSTPLLFRLRAMDTFCQIMEETQDPAQPVRELLDIDAITPYLPTAKLHAFRTLACMRPMLHFRTRDVLMILSTFRANLIANVRTRLANDIGDLPVTEPERSRALKDWYIQFSEEQRLAALMRSGAPKQAVHVFDMIRQIEKPESKSSRNLAFASIDAFLKEIEAPLFRVWMARLSQ